MAVSYTHLTHVSISDFQSNLNGLNGYVHALNEILVYDKDIMENDVLNKRIRFDCYSCLLYTSRCV